MAQTTVNVTFKVDMSEYTGAYTTVNVNGTFNNWCGSCATMTDANNDSIYELVVAVPSGSLIEYKFTIDGWTGQELFAGGEPCTMTTGGNTNRFGTFTADAVLPTVCWNDCAACGVYTPTPCGDLIISEYIEGSGSNKALELYNPTANPIDLSLYSVYCNVNSGTNNNLSSPQGMIPAYGTYIMVNSNADSALAALADTLLSGFSAVNFNGDDAILLVKGTDTLDLIGIVDNDPGSSWPVGSGSTANHTLVRKSTVDMGSADWAVGATQWDVYPSNTFSELGSHSNICSPSDVTFKVDMSQYSGTYGVVNLNGTFNNWCGGCAVMTDPDGDMIYEVTVNDIPNGVIEFKYTIDGWTGQENLTPGMACVLTTGAFTNRSFTLAGDTTLAAVCWESCDACVTANPCIVSTLPYTEDFELGFPACWDTTQNAGSVGWLAGDSASLSSTYWSIPAHTNFMASNDDACNCDMANDLLRTPQFDLTAYASQSLQLNFAYFFPTQTLSDFEVYYSMDGGPLTLISSVAHSGLTTWAGASYDVTATAGSDSVVFVFKHDDGGNWGYGAAVDDVQLTTYTPVQNVTFKVDMSEYTGTYTNVNLNGTFNNWCGACNVMTDANNDSIYEITLPIPNGLVEFKYTVDGWTGQENLTPGMACVLTTGAFTNRSFTVTADTILDAVCWESCVACPSAPSCVISTLPFMEDFEMGFPACWDTTQNAGSAGFMHGDSATMSSTYLSFPAHTNFMASNDDACNCDMSNDLLRTPQFDLTGYAGDSIVLSFEYFNNQQYDSYGTVWYSMNGGTVTFLDSMSETLTSGMWENMAIDVSATAGSDSVVFIFKHDDSAGWADGVAIDDVSVEAIAANPCVISTLPFMEDFEMGFPACWDTTQNAGSAGFMHGDSATMSSTYLSFPAHTNFMASNDDACNCDMSNDLLRTPQFDLTNYAGQGLILSFEYFNNQQYDSYGTVWYSMNGGAVTFLDSMSETLTSGAWENMTIDVSATAGSDSVVFIFRHDDSGGWADGVAIDDVSVDVGAQTSDITFAVDMTASGATFGYVNVSGNFNNWCGDCAQMTDANNDGIWELTINDVPNGPIEFKYSLDNWTSDESLTPGMSCVITTGGFTNRYLDVQGDTIMPVVCYESCAACPANPINVNITFQVDMSGNPATYTDVNLNGTFNGWCGGCAVMTDLDGDNIYDLTVPFTNITPGDTIEWKYTTDGWNDQESLTDGDPCTMTTIDGTSTFVNRMHVLTAMDETIPVVCWNSCSACTIGLEEESVFDLRLFPNPANDNVTLQWNSEEEQTIRIIDAQGRIVTTLMVSGNQNEVDIDVSSLTAGWYTVTLQSNSMYSVKKLVIQE